ncbi:Ran-specific GTPase-activating protein 30 [Pseudogymnoascus australis]
MDDFLGKITQQAMNYAIRSGIAITSGYAVGQCSRFLKTVDNNEEFHELQGLQIRLDSKIRIISPAIDMIELISARGNTSLESAVTLTKELRWDIQSLGVRLAKAASAEESARRGNGRSKSRPDHKAELRFIVQDIKRLLTRIEDAVPLINLAIATSGASLSTTLPASVSPSRLLQASTFLTACDTRYSLDPSRPIQVGPTFTLSVYMLFAGHSNRPHDERGLRDMVWKEAIHKAKVKLMRSPLSDSYDGGVPADFRSSTNTDGHGDGSTVGTSEHDDSSELQIAGEGKANEYSYRLVIVEDLDDNRVHTYEDNEPQPGPFEDVALAGLREHFPIHQISKIFYADTGKILNIGSEGEANSPVLLLKRDVNAVPPRRMMESSERDHLWDEPFKSVEREERQLEDSITYDTDTDPDESQLDIDEQLRRENSVLEPNDPPNADAQKKPVWEWVAFEVYIGSDDDESSDDEGEPGPHSAYASVRPSSSHEPPSDPDLTRSLSNLDIGSSSSTGSPSPQKRRYSRPPTAPQSSATPFGPVRSSLSLLEMLIRLTALQQFQQASHLSIPDELLNFFLEESSTTGAGGDVEERRRRRFEARQKVGFDPYDESPIKHRGEEYQYGSQPSSPARNMRGGPGFDEYDQSPLPRRGWERSRSATPNSGTPDHWLVRNKENSSGSRKGRTPEVPSSPGSPYIPAPKASRPLDRIQQERRGVQGSPLGRGVSAETDSSLGTSPLTPTLSEKSKRPENE